MRKITKKEPFKVLFVCLGNICRSPTAEGTFLHEVKSAGVGSYFQIDSAGTGSWHIGEPANSKSRMIAEKHGVELLSRAQQVRNTDMDDYDLILAMDRSNQSDLLALNGRYPDKIRLFREFDPQPDGLEVPDPYYGGLDGFEEVFQMCRRTSKALLEELKPQISAE